LLKEAALKDKREWARRMEAAPQPAFFRQHFWLAIVDEEVTLVLEGFLTLEHRNDRRSNTSPKDLLHSK